MKHVLRSALAYSAIGFVLISGAAAQETPPTENKGVSVNAVGALDLGPEIEGMSGRQLRMRIVTLEPGGMFALHSHENRPTVEYVLSGSATEFRNEAEKDYKAGDAVLADKGSTHWWRNDGTEPAVFIAVDVFQPQ